LILNWTQRVQRNSRLDAADAGHAHNVSHVAGAVDAYHHEFSALTHQANMGSDGGNLGFRLAQIYE
jgi:hypothetical protein